MWLCVCSESQDTGIKVDHSIVSTEKLENSETYYSYHQEIERKIISRIEVLKEQKNLKNGLHLLRSSIKKW